MIKNKITFKFNFLSVASTVFFSVAACVFLILGRIAHENATINPTVLTLFTFFYEGFLLLTFVSIFVSIIYAHSYFSFKKAVFSLFTGLTCILAIKLSDLVYFIASSDAAEAFAAARAITYFIEFLLYIPILLFSLFICIVFARLRAKNASAKHQKKHSPLIAALISTVAYAFCYYLLIPVIDLVFDTILPQLDVITSKDIGTIVLDILYVCQYFPAVLLGGIALTLLLWKLVNIVTGKLVLKKHYIAINNK